MFTTNRDASTRIAPELSVDEIIARWPRTIGIMNDLGLDTCCGAWMPLRRAARDAGVPLADLLARLDQAVAELEADPWPVRSA